MSEQERLRIYTVPKVVAEVAATFDAATFIAARGVWEGESEDSVIIELVSDDAQYLDDSIILVARSAHALGEDAIMVTREPIDMRLIFTDHAWIESVR